MMKDEFVELANLAGISPQRAKVLHYVVKHGEQVTAKDVELNLQIAQPRAHGALKWLAKHGYVKKDRKKFQGRGKPYWLFKSRYTLKETGEKFIETIETEKEAFIEEYDKKTTRIRDRFGL